MLDRINPVLRIACLILGGLLVARLAGFAIRKDPLAELTAPARSAELATRTNLANAATAPAVVPAGAGGVRPNVPPPGQPVAGPGPAIPPLVQARVERIVQSEILGAIMRPQPMALFGIAGRDVFLRAPNGQTGMVREGEELGGVKILRVGANRVLVEHEKKQTELTIFSGIGSDTLLPK